MRSFFRRLGIFFLLIGVLVGLERLAHKLTDGFGYTSITSNLPYQPEWDITYAAEDVEEMERALAQPYTYLASGSQSYAFISADKQYVIKFFKHKRWRLHPFIAGIPLPPSLEQKRAKWQSKKWETVRDTFGSCKTAYTEFKDDTGVIYVRLNKNTPLNHLLTVKDPIGFKHEIQLNDVEFILQRKAIPTDIYLLELKKAGKLQEAEHALTELINFTLKRAEKGYSDKDPHLIRNFGFIDDKAIELDVGGFHRDPKKDLHYFHTREIERIKSKLFPWLEANYPELTPFAQEAFEQICEPIST